MANELTDREKVMFECLKKKGTATAEEIADALDKAALGGYGGKSGLSVMMKYLAAKLAPTGYIVERISGIGRGAKGVYEMKKKF